jgi:hypothetical protein
VSVEVRPPITRLAVQRLFNRKSSHQAEDIAMQHANQGPSRPRQPNVLPFSASWRCYPGNLGSVRQMPQLLP